MSKDNIRRGDIGQSRKGTQSLFSKKHLLSMKSQSRSKYDKIKAGNLSEARSYIIDLPLHKNQQYLRANLLERQQKGKLQEGNFQ